MYSDRATYMYYKQKLLVHFFTNFTPKLALTLTVTQSLQFMLEVEDDEDWLVSDTAEEEDDNTR